MKIDNQKTKLTSRLLALKELMDPMVYGDTYITKDLATILITHMKDYTLELEGKFGNPKVEEKEKEKSLKKGDDIDHFYFIRKTRHGCPKVEYRKVGDKGITHIEVTNVGKSYQTDKHLKRIRITGLKEDGKTEYQMYFKDVFTEPTDALKNKYRDMANQYIIAIDNEIDRLSIISQKHARIIDESRELIKDIPCDEI